MKYPGHQVFDLFEGVTSQLIVIIDGQAVYLNHYPFLCYGGTWRKDAVWQLYGYVHFGPHCEGKDMDRLNITFPYQYDVGIDNNNYAPVSWKQIKNIINKQVNG